MSCNNVCGCGNSAGPLLGHPNCVKTFGADARYFFQRWLKDDGKRNFIDFSTPPFDGSFFDNLMRVVPDDEKLYLTPIVENLEIPLEDDEIWEGDYGRYAKRTKRVGNSYTMWLPDEEATFEALCQLQKLECGTWGLYNIDENGSILGDASDFASNKKLFPIPITRLNVKRQPANNDAPAMIRVTFKIEDNYNECKNNFLTCSALEVNLVTLPPIHKVTIVQGSSPNTSTDIFVDVNSIFTDGSMQLLPVKGLKVANFKVLEADGISDQSPVSVTEVSNGIYRLTGTYVPASDAIVVLDYEGHFAQPLTVQIP